VETSEERSRATQGEFGVCIHERLEDRRTSGRPVSRPSSRGREKPNLPRSKLRSARVRVWGLLQASSWLRGSAWEEEVFAGVRLQPAAEGRPPSRLEREPWRGRPGSFVVAKAAVRASCESSQPGGRGRSKKPVCPRLSGGIPGAPAG